MGWRDDYSEEELETFDESEWHQHPTDPALWRRIVVSETTDAEATIRFLTHMELGVPMRELPERDHWNGVYLYVEPTEDGGFQARALIGHETGEKHVVLRPYLTAEDAMAAMDAAFTEVEKPPFKPTWTGD